MGGDSGGRTAAVLVRGVQCHVAPLVEPFTCLREVPDGVSTNKTSRIGGLLPDAWTSFRS